MNTVFISRKIFKYIAWEPSAGYMDGLTYEISKTANTMDTANVRWQNKDINAVKVKIEEEQSRNKETKHTTETVGYMLFSY